MPDVQVVGCSFPFSVPLASTVPGGINQGRSRPSRGSVVRFDPEGLLPDSDGERSGQLQPASALQTVRPGLDWTARGTEAEMSSGTRSTYVTVLATLVSACARLWLWAWLIQQRWGLVGAPGWTGCRSKVMSPWDKISAPELPGKCFCFSFPSMCVKDWFRFLGSSVTPVKHYFCNVILLIKLQMS